jgi:acyl-CoA synthetase (AMP-forming)/AMP-acid ligase II
MPPALRWPSLGEGSTRKSENSIQCGRWFRVSTAHSTSCVCRLIGQARRGRRRAVDAQSGRRVPAITKLSQKTSKVLAESSYLSGDLMCRDEIGFYYFVDHADDVLVCSGKNIYPTKWRKCLSAIRLCSRATVAPLQGDESGQIPVAFIVSKTDAQVKLPWAGTNKIDRTAPIEHARALEAAHACSQ